MGYYLSKRNEEILKEFLPILKNATSTIKLETNDPGRLIYIIRNAANDNRFSWLRTKFIFSASTHITENGISPVVVCKIRQTTVAVVDGITTYNDRADLVIIVNYLIQNKPDMIRFTNYFLTDSEYERLEAYCEVNRYKISKDLNGITVIKNGS